MVRQEGEPARHTWYVRCWSRIVDRLTFCVVSCKVNNAAKCVGSEFQLFVVNLSLILFVSES